MENCMYNYMDCTSIMFDKDVRYCVYYKQNETSFHINKRMLDPKIMGHIK